MSNNIYNQAATEFLRRRVAGTKAPLLDAKIKPKNLEDALQIHQEMIALNTAKVGGWKCLLPTSDESIVAPIFSGCIHRGDVCELFKDNNVARIEPEIAFVLSRELPANPDGYSEEEINAAIGSCHMALELMQERHADDIGLEFFEKLADGLLNQGMFIGPELDREKVFAAASIDITVTQGEHVQTFAGKHPNASAQKPVYWLINFMTRRGVSFQAGEAIITGSYCGIVEGEFNKLTTIKYDGLGEYQVTFKEK